VTVHLTVLSAVPGRAGSLVSTPNRLDDQGNPIIGIVTPPAGMSAGSNYDLLTKADSVYCDCAKYELSPIPGGVPTLPGASGVQGYNTNSYVVGLLAAAGGTPTHQFKQLCRRKFPLPPSYFGH
jgi:hypothetical protein